MVSEAVDDRLEINGPPTMIVEVITIAIPSTALGKYYTLFLFLQCTAASPESFISHTYQRRLSTILKAI